MREPRDLIAALFWLAASVTTTPALAATHSFALYETHCAKCHGKTGAADTWRGRLSFAEDFTDASFQQGNDNSDILKAIDRGPGVMPAFEEKLSLDERKALVQVIRSFGAAAAP